jgi:hypothetical protein
MPLLGSNDQDQADDSADILGEVSLKSFTAQPTNIGPFGASVLSWSVSGPAGFHVELNSQNVAKTGTRVVQPVATTSYRLSAHSGQASKQLGTVQIIVDRSSCETYDIGNPRSAMEAPLRQRIRNSEDLSFRSDPGLFFTFSPGRIRMKLYLKKEFNNFPNPDVDIDASFGLAVLDGALVPIREQISVDIRFPRWVWLIPGVALPLSIAIDMGKESATKKMQEAIAGMVLVLNFHALPPLGKRLSTVRVDDGNNGAGVVELTACSQDLLVKFADLSSGVILK